MMENPTHAETRIGNNRLKLFGIKNSWMVRVLFEKSSIRPTKRGLRPKLTSEVRWPDINKRIKVFTYQFQEHIIFFSEGTDS